MCILSKPKAAPIAAAIVPDQELPEIKAPAIKKATDTFKLDKKRKGSSKFRIKRDNAVAINSGGSGLSIPK